MSQLNIALNNPAPFSCAIRRDSLRVHYHRLIVAPMERTSTLFSYSIRDQTTRIDGEGPPLLSLFAAFLTEFFFYVRETVAHRLVIYEWVV